MHARAARSTWPSKTPQNRPRNPSSTGPSPLRAIGREFKCDNLAEHAIEQGWTEDQLRQEILNRVKANAGGRDPLHFNVVVEPAHEGKPFKSFGEQLSAIVATARNKGHIDKRLLEVKAASGASETVDSDERLPRPDRLHHGPAHQGQRDRSPRPSLLRDPARRHPTRSPHRRRDRPGHRLPLGRRPGLPRRRGRHGNGQKPKFAKLEMKLEKMMGIFYSTDELLEDSTALESIASRAFAEELAFKTDDEILNGTGAGQMLGILNAGCLVSQAKETGQAAATIVAENIIKMYSRMPARNKANAVWLINSETMPQIIQLNMTIGTAGVPLFMPPGGLSQSPYGNIFGKPVIEVEQCAALGTVGDVLFVDLSQYAIITKGGIKSDQSIHVRFLYDENCFKWTVRNNGQPIWKSALTPYKGSATVSPFVALATRA
ncbi:MAG: phage major capsid protein [Desulfobacterales bacterium]|nr:phage major capsid protein [Desulfobacterales bacterium]